MSDPKKQRKEVEIEELEIRKETLEDLTRTEAEGAEGGMARASAVCQTRVEDGCPPPTIGCLAI